RPDIAQRADVRRLHVQPDAAAERVAAEHLGGRVRRMIVRYSDADGDIVIDTSHLAFENRQQPRQLPTAVVSWHQQFPKTDVGVVRYELRHSRSDDPNVPFTSGTLSVLVSDVHVLVREQAVSHDGSMPVLFGIPVNLDTEARSFELCMIVAAVQAHVVLLAVD